MIRGKSVCKNIAIYSYQAYKMTHPENTDDDYFNANNIFKIMGKVFSSNQDVSSIRFTIIDEDYFNWLKKARLDNGPDARKQYMQSVSDKRQNELWQMYGLHQTIDLYSIPVRFTFSKPTLGNYTNLKMSLENVKRIENKIESNCRLPKGSVMVFHNIFDEFTLFEGGHYDELVDMASQYMNNNEFIKNPDFDVQRVVPQSTDAYFHVIVAYRVAIPREVNRNFYVNEISSTRITDCLIDREYISKQIERATVTYATALSQNLMTLEDAHFAIVANVQGAMFETIE